ncbi:MAG: hypothetical protein EZS28_017201 [Streblomastix strix]|uniref:Uncharacterized protein n=1 Tax=Streblomastix strix TaxID=222440 RepID=A0A5J4VY45_9EUKA|nr:MAG: hypothetical protein EZS28_017201 [Streblomastix strix]
MDSRRNSTSVGPSKSNPQYNSKKRYNYGKQITLVSGDIVTIVLDWFSCSMALQYVIEDWTYGTEKIF